MVRALDAADLRVADLQLHQPSLDDVFLAKTGRKLDADERAARRSRPDAARSRPGEMARRSILQTLRQPAMVDPADPVPADPDGDQRRRARRGDQLPGFPPADSYLDFAIAFPFIQGSLFASINAGTASRATSRPASSIGSR